MTDATTALLRALRSHMNTAQVMNFVSENIVSRTWTSATFSGVRHVVAFRLEGLGAETAADAFLSNLADAEFALRGLILADIALLSREDREGVVRIAVEALTIEDG
ncbi:MAG: hypothetical protein M3Q15_03250 [Pseudomonadota bacterium]|nr:hypothetical protein [Pseudomonadota bacterium]